MPARVAARVSSTAPAIDPWSVRPIAGIPSSAARATSGSIRHAPSRMEYSLWTWRWTYGWPLGTDVHPTDRRRRSRRASKDAERPLADLELGTDPRAGRQDQLVQDPLVAGVGRVPPEGVGVVHVDDQRHVGVPLAKAGIAPQRPGANHVEPCQHRPQLGLDPVHVRGLSALVPAEEDDVPEHGQSESCEPLRRRRASTAAPATAAAAPPTSGIRLRCGRTASTMRSLTGFRARRPTTLRATRLPTTYDAYPTAAFRCLSEITPALYSTASDEIPHSGDSCRPQNGRSLRT